MRFGIQSMQLASLVPAGMPPGDLMGHIAGFDHAQVVETLAAEGFNPIELSADLAIFLPHTYSPTTINRLAALKERLGISYTVHLPLWSVEPSTPLDSVRQGSLEALVDAVRLTQPLQPEVYVLHATGALAAEFYRMRLPSVAHQVILDQFRRGAGWSISRLLEHTALAPRQLALETVEFPFDLTLALAEEFDTSICFDTGHVLVGFSGPVDLFEALESCLPRLGEVHLHDGPWQGPEQRIGYGLDHQPLGAGDLQVPRFLERLVEARYAGPLVFELTVPEALASLRFIQQALP